MTKHRTITGFVAVALLAVAVTAANVSSLAFDGLLRRHDYVERLDGRGEHPTASFDERWFAISASKTDTAEHGSMFAKCRRRLLGKL